MRLTSNIKDKIVNKLLEERRAKAAKDKLKLSLEFKEEYSKTLPKEIQSLLNNKELGEYLNTTTYFYINCSKTLSMKVNLQFIVDYIVKIPNYRKPGGLTISNELYDKIKAHTDEEKLLLTLSSRIRGRLSNIQTDGVLHNIFPEAYQAFKKVSTSIPEVEVKKLNKVITIDHLMLQQ